VYQLEKALMFEISSFQGVAGEEEIDRKETIKLLISFMNQFQKDKALKGHIRKQDKHLVSLKTALGLLVNFF
jgi:hypothetical protein